MNVDELRRALRTLRDVALEARAYVADWTTADKADAHHESQRRANALLERVDGAIADADEVLS